MSDTIRDPFEALLADASPLVPQPGFAADLRARLAATFDVPGRHATTSPIIPSTGIPSTGTPSTGTPSTVVPRITVSNAASAIEFYVEVFGAVEDHRLVGDDGRIGHAELVIGTSRLTLADEYPEAGALAPVASDATSVRFGIEVADADATVAHALARGATLVRPVTDQFHGHRQGVIRDPFGHHWMIGSPLPGFDEARYITSSAAIGFEHRTDRRSE